MFVPKQLVEIALETSSFDTLWCSRCSRHTKNVPHKAHVINHRESPSPMVGHTNSVINTIRPTVPSGRTYE